AGESQVDDVVAGSSVSSLDGRTQSNSASRRVEDIGHAVDIKDRRGEAAFQGLQTKAPRAHTGPGDTLLALPGSVGEHLNECAGDAVTHGVLAPRSRESAGNPGRDARADSIRGRRRDRLGVALQSVLIRYALPVRQSSCHRSTAVNSFCWF